MVKEPGTLNRRAARHQLEIVCKDNLQLHGWNTKRINASTFVSIICGYRYTYDMRDQIHHEIESLVLDESHETKF